MGNEFSVQTLKVKSKMASNRMAMHMSKKENALTKQRRGIAQLLVDDKEQSARIRVEGVIREESTARVMEWLQMMCDLIHQRVKQIQISKECPDDLVETCCTILYCAKRIDIPELSEVAAQFQGKWGKAWFDQNIENRSGRVSRQIVEKLSPQPPTRAAVDKRLKEIADEFDIDWEPQKADAELNGGDGGSMPAIVGHRNEFTVEFASKPFGMEWTATEDRLNLWVSNITKKTPAHRAGVMQGSMIIALNGINVQNTGAPKIHDRASKLGLPIRITFRRPVAGGPAGGGKGSGGAVRDMKVDPDKVNQCVGILKDPCNWELSDDQKKAICKKNGANVAEIAAAVFLAAQSIQYTQAQAAQPAPQMQGGYGYGVSGPVQSYQSGPSSSDFPGGMPVAAPPAYQGGPQPGVPNGSGGGPTYMGGAMDGSSGGVTGGGGGGGLGGGSAVMPVEDDVPPPSSHSQADDASGGGDLDSLEARFAALRKGL